MVARVLKDCGLYLGEEHELIDANDHNRSGYWEHRAFVALNDEILAAAGGGWDLPPAFDQGWEASATIRPLAAAAERLADGFDGHEPWGWKDPRTTLTLPLWLRTLPGLRIVVCARHPLEVADSLAGRAPCSIAFALGLWHEYNRAALELAPASARIVTHYDRWFENPREELDRVVAAVGLEPSGAALDRAQSRIAASLRHHDRPADDLLAAHAPAELVECYAAICSEAGVDSPPGEGAGRIEPARSDPAANHLHAERLLRAEHAAQAAQRELATLREQVSELSERAERATSGATQATGRARRAEASAERLRDDAKARAQRAADLEARCRELERAADRGWLRRIQSAALAQRKARRRPSA